MFEIFIAILMALGTCFSSNSPKCSDNNGTVVTQGNDTGGEGGHIPPIHP